MTIIRRDDGQEFVLRLSPSVTHAVVPYAAVIDTKELAAREVTMGDAHSSRTAATDGADALRVLLRRAYEHNAHCYDVRDALLAALKALVSETEARDNPSDQGVDAHCDEMKAARAAIAKAEGR